MDSSTLLASTRCSNIYPPYSTLIFLLTPRPALATPKLRRNCPVYHLFCSPYVSKSWHGMTVFDFSGETEVMPQQTLFGPPLTPLRASSIHSCNLCIPNYTYFIAIKPLQEKRQLK